jgi:CHAD domain-containing protein
MGRDDNRNADQTFRLSRGEAIPDGIRRTARAQLDEAHAEFAPGPKRNLAKAVHNTRKNFKRVRATVRLARTAIGDDAYRRENTGLRDAGRRLSGVRDASVLIETLDKVENASASRLPSGGTLRLRERLEAEGEQAIDSLEADPGRVAAVVGDIEQAHARIALWVFETDSFDALRPGLRRSYGRGRKAMRRAEADPSVENLHEWRKRVKDLWHAEQILRSAAPKKMKRRAKRTHVLADLLGDDHDLAELRLDVAGHGEDFDDGGATQVTLLALIDRRRKELQRKAFNVGTKVYRRRPNRYVKRIGRRWCKRARPPQPASA